MWPLVGEENKNTTKERAGARSTPENTLLTMTVQKTVSNSISEHRGGTVRVTHSKADYLHHQRPAG